MEKRTIDQSYVKYVKQLLEQQSNENITSLLHSMYAQDIAELLDKVQSDEARLLMSMVEKDKIIKVLVEMEENVRESFLSAYSPKDIADEFIQNMDSDDAAYILNQLPVKEKEDVIASLTDIAYASSLLSLLSYEEHTAGSLMAVELVKANVEWTVGQCVEEIRRQAENVDPIYVVYVVDYYERLLLPV